MGTKYVELFRIQCRHGYFRDQPCRALELSPTVQCARLLKRYGCLFRKTIGGGSVYYATSDTDGDGADLLSQFDEALPFAFALTGPSALLGNCTSIKLPKPGVASVYHFSNRKEYTATFDKEEYLLLHRPAPPEESEKSKEPLADDLLPVHPPEFVHTFDKSIVPATVRLFDILGNEVALNDKAGKQEPRPQEMRVLSLDLGGIAEGRYRLKADDDVVYEFYLRNAASPDRWGVVEIFAGGSKMAGVPEPCQVLSPDGPKKKPVAFAISLEPRGSYWRYHIIRQSSVNGASSALADQKIEEYQINVGPKNGKSNSAATFSFSPPVKKVNGKDAWVFQSEKPIALYEYPGNKQQFQLEYNKGSTDEKGNHPGPFVLPYGRAETTRMEESANGKKEFWSEIYVYL